MWDEDEPGFIHATPEEAATIPEVKYEYLDHPADIQIHAWGDNLREAYEQAAMGMFGYMTDPETVEIEEVREVEAEAEDLQGLLFHFLDECLFMFCCEPFFIARKVVITEWSAGGVSVAGGKEANGKGEGKGGGRSGGESKEVKGKEGGAGGEGKGDREGSSSDGKDEKSKEKEGEGGGASDAGGKGKGNESGLKGDSSKSEEQAVDVEDCGSSDGKKGENSKKAKEDETGKAKDEDTKVTEQGSSDSKHATDTEREQGDFEGTGGEATGGHEGSGAGMLRIRARLYGEEFQLDKHPQGTEVKAITYASMQVYDKPGHHEVFVIVDI